jgi:hypothetical protein
VPFDALDAVRREADEVVRREAVDLPPFEVLRLEVEVERAPREVPFLPVDLFVPELARDELLLEDRVVCAIYVSPLLFSPLLASMPAAPIAPAVHWNYPFAEDLNCPPIACSMHALRVSAEHGLTSGSRGSKEIGRDAPAEVSIQQEVPIHPEESLLRRLKEFFNEGSLVLLEEPLQRELQKPVVRVKSFFVSQQVRG